MLWAGRILSGFIVLFFVFGGVIGLMKLPENVEKFKQYGFAPELGTKIAIIMLICTLFYAIPRTAVLGAILLTGYLGGATVTHVRVSEPFFLPVAFGVLVWLGLFLRDARVRALFLS
jgi:multisubunit Na+/H+ antiporter MnhG subunit